MTWLRQIPGVREIEFDGETLPRTSDLIIGTGLAASYDPATRKTTLATNASGLPAGTATYQPLTWNGSAWVGAALNLAQAAAVTGVLGVANGGVPVPANPADDAKVLTASGGTYTWTVAPTGLPALGAANTVLRVNAGGVAVEYAKLTTANLDAAAGIVGTQLSATAAIAASQLAAGGANTVLQGGTPNTWTATPTVTSLAATYIALGADPADAGAIRLSHAMGVYGESNTPGTDGAVLTWGVVANDVVGLGDASFVTRVTGSALHAYAGATQVSQLGVATSDFLKMGDVPAATGYLRVDDSWTLIQRNGNPGTADRNVIVCGGETVSVGDAAQTGNVLLRKSGCTVTLGSNYVQCLGSSQVILAAGGVSGLIVEGAQFRVNVASYRWETSVVSPKLYQNDDATNSATGDLMTLQAQNCTGTTSIGGSLVVTSGTGTTSDGAVRIAIGTESMVEACEVAAGRRIVALCRGSALTTTQMPSGTGDRVVYIENCATARSTGTPVGGGMLEVVGGDVFWINEAGVRNQLN